MEENQNQFYLGVKLIKARPMNLGDYNKFRRWQIPKNEDPATEGYLVQYPDGYVSWCPKAEFERWYMVVPGDGTKVTEEMVNAMIGNRVEKQYDEKTSLVQVDTLTGFRIIETSSCVDPANFNQAIGVEICMERIKNVLWKGLGFALQWGKNGLK